MKQKTEPNKTNDKKIPRSLNKLLQTEKDFKKMNLDLKKALKKIKTLEKENSELSNKFENK